MALLARVKSPEWVDGNVLTAGDLVAEFNNIINGLNGANDISVINVTASGNVAVTGNVSAANASFSGNASVLGTLTSGLSVHGSAINLGLSLTGGILTLTNAGGSSLSSSEKGYVYMASTSAGLSVSIPITSSVLIHDDSHASSDFTNEEFGISTGTNWANDMPFFLYIVNRGNTPVDGTDGNSAVFIARNPCLAITPASANDIGDTDNIPSNDNQGVIILWGSYTQGNYTSKPCQLIGAVRMRYATATADWTVQVLGDNDGIGSDQLRKTFATVWTMPLAQNGAAAGTFCLANSGTAPVFSTNTYKYRIMQTGMVDTRVYLNGDGGADGAGAVTLLVALPYTALTDSDVGLYWGSGALVYAGGGSKAMIAPGVEQGTLSSAFVTYTAVTVLNSDIASGTRTLEYSLTYKAY